MPYDYRKLSLPEREEIVRYRRERGYPLQASPHPFREAGVYLITAATSEHAFVMESPDRRTEFELLLLEAMRNIHGEMIAWVVLPNHYHFLVEFNSLDPVSAAIKHLHGATSRQWNIEDGLPGQRRIWYKFSDRLMRSEQQLYQTFNYLHYNPIKHGYANDFNEWPWSSYALYEESKGVNWLQEVWNSNTPPEELGQGWDDQQV